VQSADSAARIRRWGRTITDTIFRESVAVSSWLGLACMHVSSVLLTDCMQLQPASLHLSAPDSALFAGTRRGHMQCMAEHSEHWALSRTNERLTLITCWLTRCLSRLLICQVVNFMSIFTARLMFNVLTTALTLTTGTAVVPWLFSPSPRYYRNIW